MAPALLTYLPSHPHIFLYNHCGSRCERLPASQRLPRPFPCQCLSAHPCLGQGDSILTSHHSLALPVLRVMYMESHCRHAMVSGFFAHYYVWKISPCCWIDLVLNQTPQNTTELQMNFQKKKKKVIRLLYCMHFKLYLLKTLWIYTVPLSSVRKLFF